MWSYIFGIMILIRVLQLLMEIIWTNVELLKKFYNIKHVKKFCQEPKKGRNSLFDVYVKF
jgi:hypothetical protein